MKKPPYFLAFVLIGGCNPTTNSTQTEPPTKSAVAGLSSLDFADADQIESPMDKNATLRAEVLLDQAGFSIGVIDGKVDASFRSSVSAFQNAHDLPESGQIDAATRALFDQKRSVRTTRRVIIPAAFAKGPFFPEFPTDAAGQAALPALGYRSLMEALAERFHTTPDTLVALNSPTTAIGPGKIIRVPNIPTPKVSVQGSDGHAWSDTLRRLGIASEQPSAERVVVDKSAGVLKVYGAADRLIAQFPATMGSRNDPLPIGDWTIKGVSRNPVFHYNPKLFWDVSDEKSAQILKPGPNSPVGVVWLDLNKAHYGIHGTSEPHSIGKSESHGCIRLTNWDAARLAQMITPGTPAKFTP